MMQDQLLPLPATAVSVAAGAAATIVSTAEGETTGRDVYLAALGTGVDPVSNKDYATVRLLVNGNQCYPFGGMTSQVGSTTLPQRYNPPILLGRGVKVSLYGEMAAGATGNTAMAGTLELLLKDPA